VTRFETKVAGEVTEVTKTERMSHEELLKRFLKDTDATKAERELALKMGTKIIEEIRA
jgi:hypothetical protein